VEDYALSQWADKLDIYLVKTGITKKQLAERLDISINTVGKWWRDREPSPEYVAKIEQLLLEDTTSDTTLSGINASATGEEKDRGCTLVEQSPEESTNRGKRFQDNSVVISLLRTTCPFCANVVERYRNCPNCGQHFVWANVPLERSGSD